MCVILVTAGSTPGHHSSLVLALTPNQICALFPKGRVAFLQTIRHILVLCIVLYCIQTSFLDQDICRDDSYNVSVHTCTYCPLCISSYVFLHILFIWQTSLYGMYLDLKQAYEAIWIGGDVWRYWMVVGVDRTPCN